MSYENREAATLDLSKTVHRTKSESGKIQKMLNNKVFVDKVFPVVANILSLLAGAVIVLAFIRFFG